MAGDNMLKSLVEKINSGDVNSVTEKEVIYSLTGVRSDKPVKNIIGQKFGFLTVVERLQNRPSGKTPSGLPYYKCICDCGKERNVIADNLIQGHTISCGCKHRTRLSKGEANAIDVYNGYRRGAEKRGYRFLLSFEKFKEITQQNCFYCDIPPSTLTTIDRLNGKYLYNGIDRVDNSKGYIKDNMVACCRVCNRMKSNYLFEDFIDKIKKIYLNIFSS